MYFVVKQINRSRSNFSFFFAFFKKRREYCDKYAMCMSNRRLAGAVIPKYRIHSRDKNKKSSR